MPYKTLRTGAFRLRPDADLVRSVQVLAFPDDWKGPLLQLERAKSNRDLGERVSISIDSLNRTVLALVPDVVSIAQRAGHRERAPWLVSDQPVPTDRLLLLVHPWVRTTYDAVHDAEVRAVLAGMRADQLTWQTELVDLGAWQPAARNGTATWVPREGQAYGLSPYRLLPDLLAALLSGPGVAWEHGGERLRFRRTGQAGNQQGAELMSWPPLSEVDRKGTHWYYSVVVHLTVQSYAFDPAPVVHCAIGLRRWVSVATDPAYRRGLSVYLHTNVPWIEGLHHSPSFQVAMIERAWLPPQQGSNGKPYGIAWKRDLAPILKRLTSHLQVPFPTPSLLCEDPAEYLAPGDGVTAALVHSTSLSTSHFIGAGALPGDRLPLLDWIGETLEDLLTPVDLLPRVDAYARRQRTDGPIGPFHADTADEAALARLAKQGKTAREKNPLPLPELASARRTAVAKATAGPLEIHVLYQTDDLRAQIEWGLGEFLQFLGLDQAPTETPEPDMRIWETAELTLIVRSQELGELGSALALDPKISGKSARLHAAVRARCAVIRQALPCTKHRTVALVELDGARAFWPDLDTDPKFAIRVGLADTKRLSQFIRPRGLGRRPESDGTVKNRVWKSWQDMLRQLGVQWAPPTMHLRGVELPPDLRYLGLWLHRQQRGASPMAQAQQFPVAILQAANSHDTYLRAPGWDAWLTYADALLKLSQDAARDGLTRFYTDDQVLAFIRLILNELKGTPVLVLAEAINLRGCWKWLANTQILRDRIGFGGGDSGMTATAYPGMRLVRVRLCEQHETPECFGEKVSEDGAVTDFGLTQGLFALSGDRVFGSVGNKPHTAGKFSPKLSKITGWASSALDGTARPRKPNIHGWNPQMVEFTVAVLQPQDEHAWPWAAIADGLRTSAVHHEDALLLPWPLHLAKGSLAYVLPVRPDPDLEDDALDHEGSDDLE